jgi:hypothetical protein
MMVANEIKITTEIKKPTESVITVLFIKNQYKALSKVLSYMFYNPQFGYSQG